MFFAVDSGRPFAVRVASDDDGPTLLGALFTPGGRPGLDENIQGAGPDAPAEFVVDAVRHPRRRLGGRRARLAGGRRVRVRSPCGPRRYASASSGTRRAWSFRSTTARRPPPTLQVGVALVGAQRGALVPGSGARAEEVAFTAPAWARELVIDADMPRDMWSRFTDFAVALYDQSGRIVANEPMNYADVRLRTDLTEALAGQTLTLRLVPAFGDTHRHRRVDAERADPPVRRGAGAARRERRRSDPHRAPHAGRARRGAVPDASAALADAGRVLPAGPGGRDGRRPSMDPRGRTPGPDRAGDAMSGKKVVRIAAGQGFWGDWLEAPVRQVQGGPIDYLMMDYLAEVTMSIMQKQTSRDPQRRLRARLRAADGADPPRRRRRRASASPRTPAA